jgi:hypothetical protein
VVSCSSLQTLQVVLVANWVLAEVVKVTLSSLARTCAKIPSVLVFNCCCCFAAAAAASLLLLLLRCCCCFAAAAASLLLLLLLLHRLLPRGLSLTGTAS